MEIHRRLLSTARLLLLVFFLGNSGVAIAQELPTLQVNFEPLAPAAPNPCFEFACFNRSVLDGNTLAAIGATYPAVYIYVKTGSSWSYQAFLASTTPANPEHPTQDFKYTYPLALHGDELFVTRVSSRYEVEVFRRNGTQWHLQQTIVPTSPQGLPLLVAGVALDNGRALISTLGTTTIQGGLHEQGIVHVYKRGADQQYHLEAQLSPDAALDSGFGLTLALRGATAAVGAPEDNASAGAVYVFKHGKHGGWLLQRKLESPSDSAAAQFGSALALDNRTLVIGAPRALNSSTGRYGLVYVYSPLGLLRRQPQIVTDPYLPTAEDEYSHLRKFGVAVDVDGSRLIVGSSSVYPYAQEPWTYLFERQHRAWQPVAQVVDAGMTAGVQLSHSIALIDVIGFHYGTFPGIFDLPPLQKGLSGDDAAELSQDTIDPESE